MYIASRAKMYDAFSRVYIFFHRINNVVLESDNSHISSRRFFPDTRDQSCLRDSLALESNFSGNGSVSRSAKIPSYDSARRVREEKPTAPIYNGVSVAHLLHKRCRLRGDGEGRRGECTVCAVADRRRGEKPTRLKNDWGSRFPRYRGVRDSRVALSAA